MMLVLELCVLLLSLMYSITLQSSPHQSQHIHVHCISQSFPIDFLSVIIHTYMYLQNFNCLLPQARFNKITMSSWLQKPCHFIVVSLLHNFDFVETAADLTLFNPLH